ETNKLQRERAIGKDEIYAGVDFKEGRFPILDEYFRRVEVAAETNDWDSLDAWRASLSPEDDKFIDDNTGLKNDPKVKEWREDRRTIEKSGYWEVRDTVFDYFLEAQGMEKGQFKFDDYWAEVRKQYRAYAI